MLAPLGYNARDLLNDMNDRSVSSRLQRQIPQYNNESTMASAQMYQTAPINSILTRQAPQPGTLSPPSNQAQAPQPALTPQQIQERLQATLPTSLTGSRIDPMNSLRQQQLQFSAPQLSGNYSVGAGPLQGVLADFVKSGLAGKILDRESILKRLFESQLPGLERAEQLRTRDLGRRASQLGRIGSGMVNTEMGELELESRQARDSLLGQLSAQAAGQKIQDMLGIAGVGTGLEGIAAQRAMASASNRLAGDQLSLRSALEEAGFTERQQSRQDRLASEATQNQLARLGMLGGVANQSPTGDLGLYSQILQGASRAYGDASSQAGNDVASYMENQRRQPREGGGGLLGSILGMLGLS